ncbi:hypothetical protein BH11PLA1_BH11PLA1_20850 [soil metagenome]
MTSAEPHHTPAPHPPALGGLGPALEPALAATLAAQGLTLSPVHWFRSPWQRGGGSTGSTSLTTQRGETHPAIVKLPVGPEERRWTCLLSAHAAAPGAHCVTPRVLASGEEIGATDLAWLILEHCPGEIVGAAHDHASIAAMLESCAALHADCMRCGPPLAPAPAFPFDKLIAASRDAAHAGGLERASVWAHALREVALALPALVARWNARRINQWCHGDLHGGNAIRTPRGRVRLLDLALIHPGHWLEDALYLERVHWAHAHTPNAPASSPRDGAPAHATSNGATTPAAETPELRRPGWRGKQFGDRHAFSHHADAAHKNGSHTSRRAKRADQNGHAPGAATTAAPSMLSQLAACRRALGLPCDDDYGLLANTRRVLMAACAPAWLAREGSPAHLAHALHLIERLLPEVA